MRVFLSPFLPPESNLSFLPQFSPGDYVARSDFEGHFFLSARDMRLCPRVNIFSTKSESLSDIKSVYRLHIPKETIFKSLICRRSQRQSFRPFSA